MTVPPRPKITDDMIRQVTDKIAEKHQIGDPDVLVEHYQHHMDGMALAIELAKWESWDWGYELDREFVDDLDSIGFDVDRLHKQACEAWVKANDVQPPYPLGTQVKYRKYTGTLVGIHDRGPAQYLLKVDNPDWNHRGQLVVNFEDVASLTEE